MTIKNPFVCEICDALVTTDKEIDETFLFMCESCTDRIKQSQKNGEIKI